MQWVARGEGGRFRFRARDAKSMAAVIRSMSQQSASRARTQRSSHACRSCLNDCRFVMSIVWEIKQALILPCTKETLKAKFNDKHPNMLSSSQYDEVLAEEVWNSKQVYRETCLCRTCFNCRLYREAMGVVSQIIALLFKPSARQDADDACPDEEPCITNLLRLHDF